MESLLQKTSVQMRHLSDVLDKLGVNYYIEKEYSGDRVGIVLNFTMYFFFDVDAIDSAIYELKEINCDYTENIENLAEWILSSHCSDGVYFDY